MNKFSLENKTILISGATSGIGFELCQQVVKYGGNFIGLGRNIILFRNIYMKKIFQGLKL